MCRGVGERVCIHACALPSPFHCSTLHRLIRRPWWCAAPLVALGQAQRASAAPCTALVPAAPRAAWPSDTSRYKHYHIKWGALCPSRTVSHTQKPHHLRGIQPPISPRPHPRSVACPDCPLTLLAEKMRSSSLSCARLGPAVWNRFSYPACKGRVCVRASGIACAGSGPAGAAKHPVRQCGAAAAPSCSTAETTRRAGGTHP